MDPTLHTIIATGLLFIAYKIGSHLGYSKGTLAGEAHVLLLMMNALKCEKIDITETEITVYDKNGNGRKIDVNSD